MADSMSHRDWITRAEQDRLVLRTLGQKGFDGMADAVCYLCHQTTEKLLKAFLLKQRNALLKTHDLLYLLHQCAEIDARFGNHEEALIVLNQYAMAARYPGDFAGERSVSEAVEAYRYSEDFYRFILTEIGL